MFVIGNNIIRERKYKDHAPTDPLIRTTHNPLKNAYDLSDETLNTSYIYHK